MRDQDKTKEQLIDELAELRQQVVALEQGKSTWRSLVENAPEKVTVLDSDGTILYVNRTSPERTVEEVTGTSVYNYLPPGERDEIQKVLESVFQSGQTEKYESVAGRTDGTRLVYSNSVAPIIHDGQVTAAIFISTDITELKQAEGARRESEGIARALLEAPTDLVALVDADVVVLRVNEAIARRFGKLKEEFIGTQGWDLLPPELAQSRKAHFERVLRSGEPSRFEDARQGTWFDNVFYPIYGADGKVSSVALIARDITEQKRMEKRIRDSLQEKQVMLREIHHRVRHNLQVISALLNIQAAKVQDEGTGKALREAGARVQSMMLVHEQLYSTPDLAQIDFADYVEDLTANLLEAYRVNSDHITLEVDVADVFLEVDQAIPCGLIVTELVTNALKHAFPAGREGEEEIRVAFHRTAEGEYELVVSDNGVGLPAGFEFPTRDSVGLLLLNAHARGLRATVEWESDGGTTCRVVFGG